MALLEAAVAGVALVVGLGLTVALALSAYGTVLIWRARRLRRRIDRLLAGATRMDQGTDTDGPAPALPAVLDGHAGLGHPDAPSSFADDVASRLIQ